MSSVKIVLQGCVCVYMYVCAHVFMPVCSFTKCMCVCVSVFVYRHILSNSSITGKILFNACEMMLVVVIGYLELGTGQESLTHLYKSKPNNGKL